MTRMKAISILLNEKACVKSKCDKNCGACDLAKDETEIIEAFDMAIQALWYYRGSLEAEK